MFLSEDFIASLALEVFDKTRVVELKRLAGFVFITENVLRRQDQWRLETSKPNRWTKEIKRTQTKQKRERKREKKEEQGRRKKEKRDKKKRRKMSTRGEKEKRARDGKDE